jgi:hypothetical protein
MCICLILQKISCLENGVKTLELKSAEAEDQIREAEKNILPLQEKVNKAREVELIDLEKGVLIL